MNLIKPIEWIAARYWPVEFARRLGVEVGTHCRLLGISRSTFGSEPYLVKIGNHVTITGGVRFITHDGGVWVFRDEFPELELLAPIVVGNNVFIGLMSVLLPGSVVGNNVVVGAGSVIRGVLDSDSVYAGVPARRIMSLEEYRAKALERGSMTRGLGEDQKKAFFRKRFSIGA